ncbi:MAG: ferrous iron transport protein A [Clostridia bacterium]|nr:ferrous iron transport protein A [Clostridia bacterium]
MKLSDGLIGSSYAVKEISLELPAKRRLEILGMTSDAKVTVLNSKKSGTKIIKVRGTRFAIGCKFAQQIEVEEVDKRGDMI